MCFGYLTSFTIYIKNEVKHLMCFLTRYPRQRDPNAILNAVNVFFESRQIKGSRCDRLQIR